MMTTPKKKRKRDIEKDYPRQQFVAKLRRLVDCIEQDRRFQIQVAGQQIAIPADAVISIEHERDSSSEELEFQLRWPLNQ